MPLAALFGFPPWARPTLCPTPISHAAIRTTRPVLYGALAFIMLLLLAALYWGTGSSSTNAAFTLRPSALRGTSDGASMSTPGGAGTLPPLDNILELLQGSAHRLLSWGRSFLVYLVPALRFAPSRCPNPDYSRSRVSLMNKGNVILSGRSQCAGF
jgi:hypothetical protein